MRHHFIISDDLHIFVLQVLLLDHYLFNRCFLRKVQLIDSLFKQFMVNIVKRYYNLGAYRLNCLILFWWAHIHSF